MKKIFLLLALLGCLIMSAQMPTTNESKPIGEFTSMGTNYVSLSQNGELCSMTYRDDKFQRATDYKSVIFHASDLDTVHALFSDFTNVEKGQVKTFETEDGGRLTFTYSKTLGVFYAKVIHTDKHGVSGLFRYMTTNQINRVFNK